MSDTVIAPLVPVSTSATSTAALSGKPASSYGRRLMILEAAGEASDCGLQLFKVMPEWRRLPAEEKAAHKAAYAEVLARWNKPGEFLSMTYSTVGTRGDVDMCVWSIGYAVDEMNKMRSEFNGDAAGRLSGFAA